MRLDLRARLRLATMVGAVAVSSVAAAAGHAPPTGDPFSTESAVLVPLEDVSAISIVGIRGQILISTREKRELQVISRALGAEGAELPVGIWVDGGRLIVAPVPGDRGGPRVLDVEVPKGLTIAVDAADSEIGIASEGGTVDLRGDNVRASVQAIGGSVTADLLAGTLNVRNSRDATLRLRATAATIEAMSGSVTVRATGGTVTVATGVGSTEVESEDSKLSFDGLLGPLHVTAQKGEAKIAGIKGGAELALVGTPLRMKEGKGNIVVTSDTPVIFEAMAASMHFDMDGGSLHGKGNEGILELRGRNTELNVESITGGMRVQGDGLTVKIVDVGGELQVEAVVSNVVVDRAANVVLKVDRGNVTLQRATGTVQANVVGGDVRIIDVSGSVNLELDSGEGEVSWASLSGEKDSNLVSKNGNLTVRFPVSGGCRVEAKSKDGRIDSDLPTVRVLEGSDEAQGPVNSGYRPIVRITATGDIHLLGAAKAP